MTNELKANFLNWKMVTNKALLYGLLKYFEMCAFVVWGHWHVLLEKSRRNKSKPSKRL
jgi:hypothetical protein